MKISESTFVVFGLARTGLAAVKWLLENGAKQVIALDNDSVKQQQAASLGAKIVPLDQLFWPDVDVLIQSPGIPISHSVTVMARNHGVKIMGDCDVFRLGHPDAKIIGVTGTNGKSTTTTLVGHILKSAGLPVAVGGNVGVPILSLPKLPPEGYYVFELSSFQLELSICLNLDIAGWLNISSDHLDRHGSMADYVEAKSRLLLHYKHPKAVIGIDDQWSANVYYRQNKQNPGDTVSVAVTTQHDADYVVRDGILFYQGERLLSFAGLQRLQGDHNYQNIAVAWGICKFAGLSNDEIAAGILSFPGLAHRQEFVRQVDHITFINDSKATNADAAAKALATFDNIYWIVGGHPKSEGIEPLKNFFPKIKHAFLIGEAQDRFADTIADAISYSRCGNLNTAVEKAYELAKQNGEDECCVLLSPACSSFDQFRDFEHRGDTFRELVMGLAGDKKL